MSDAAARAVPCPHCGAEAGEPCHSKKGRVYSDRLHVQRKRAVRPEPTDSICLAVGAPVVGCPAKPGQVALIQDDGPGRHLTVRVGADKESARASDPVGFLGIAFLRGIVGNAAPEEEVFTTDVIDLNEVRRRWDGAKYRKEAHG